MKTLVIALMFSLGLFQPGEALAIGSKPDNSGSARIRMTLDEAIREALESNPGIKALSHQSRAAGLEATGVALTRLGSLDGIGWYSRYQDDQIVRPMASELMAGGFAGLPFDRNQVHYGLTYQVPLYLGGALTGRIKIASLEAKKSTALLEGTRWQVRYNVTALFAGVLTLEAQDSAVLNHIAVLEKTLQRLDLMVEQGKLPELDRLKVREQLAGVRAQQASVQAESIRARTLLLTLLGRDPAENLSLEPPSEEIPVLLESPQALREGVLAASPIQQAELAAAQAKSAVGVARSEFLPSIAARANLLENEAPSLDSPLRTWDVTVGVSLPIFNGGSREVRFAAAREKQLATREALEKSRLDAAAQLEQALANFTAAVTREQAARERIAAAEEAARIEQVRYETGADTIEDLLRAWALEQDSRAELARSRGDVHISAQWINTLVEKEVVQ
jgi:outer membrane protein TolC